MAGLLILLIIIIVILLAYLIDYINTSTSLKVNSRINRVGYKISNAFRF